MVEMDIVLETNNRADTKCTYYILLHVLQTNDNKIWQCIYMIRVLRNRPNKDEIGQNSMEVWPFVVQ